MSKWLHIVFLLLSFSIYSQEILVNVDKEEIQIGEPFVYTLSIVSDSKLDTVLYTPHSGIYPAKSNSGSITEGISTEYELEILESFHDTVYQENNQFIWRGTYVLTAWDSAYVVLPPEKLFFNDKQHYSPASLIKVSSPIADASRPIYDIHEEFTNIDDGNLILNFLKKFWWLALAILIVGGYFLSKVFQKKEKVIIPLSLRQQTLQQIDELEKGKGFEMNLKEYYYDLSIILRQFFAAHYKTPIMDKTTVEIQDVLKNAGLDSRMVVLTRQLLTQSDMVKFAKSKPSLNEILSITNSARRVVNEVADLDLTDE